MATLIPVQRVFVRSQVAGGFVINFFLNGGLAWLTFPPVAALPVWARGNCIAGDTIGTSFFLPLITCLVLTSIVRRLLRLERLPGLAREALPAALRFWPRNIVGRGALVGLACALSFAAATLALLTALGIDSMTRAQVAVYKAIYTGLLGALVTPLFGWRALADKAAQK